jgi:CopA family copper-resistance protein
MYESESNTSTQPKQVSRRRFVQGVAAGSAIAGFGPETLSALGESAPRTPSVLCGTNIDLHIDRMPVNFTGRKAMATTFNGSLPGPTLRFREGDTVTIAVTNHLKDSSSVHWHGLRIPAAMDGVPGLSFRGIEPGETFRYRFQLKQSGTYWYHSHTRFQEQMGLSGALIIDPLRRESVEFDREYIVFLSDWTDSNPESVFSNLKQQSDYYNYGRQTVGNFVSAVRSNGFKKTVSDRLAWSKMNMSPTDILDITGATYTYLANGNSPKENWTALFKAGERVRLRFINGSSMTIFDVRIPGLKMTVVQADGNDVQPVTVDEFRMGVAETYDVIVEPAAKTAYAIFAQSEDRSGYAHCTLTPKSGMVAAVPAMDPRPKRTMQDMGMGEMKGMGMSGKRRPDMRGMDVSGKTATSGSTGGQKKALQSGDMSGMQMNGMQGMDMSGTSEPKKKSASASDSKRSSGDNTGGMQMGAGCDQKESQTKMAGSDVMSGMRMGSSDGKTPFPQPGPNVMPMGDSSPVAVKKTAGPELHLGPQVDQIPMSVTERLNNAGDGLRDNGRRVLTYADLRARYRGVDMRPPSREIELRLTGNMERYIWGINGRKFSSAEPIHMKVGERLRIVLINNTMMEHPMHLHGLWSELENGNGEFLPYKHTIIVKPAERVSYLLSADTPGNWAFHCHMLYHMEAGMFRTVVVS